MSPKRLIVLIITSFSQVAFAVPLGNIEPYVLQFNHPDTSSSSAPKRVTLSNTGSTTLTLTDMKVPPEFSLGDPCFTEGVACFRKPDLPCTAIEPGKACTFNIWYTPSTRPGTSGSARFYSDAIGSPHSVTLTGINEPVAQCSLFLPAAPLTFSDITVGATDPTLQTFSVTNDSAASQTLAAHASGDFFIDPATTSCGAVLGAKQTCKLNIAFHPTVSGDRRGYVGYASDDLCPGIKGRYLFGRGAGSSPNNPAAEGPPVNPTLPTQADPNAGKDTGGTTDKTTDSKGCSMGKGGAFDPMLPLLMLGAMLRPFKNRAR
ncbi:MAG: choice-of-anchor D domain-containing protein [Burkholderiales bacterium]